jgi:hypothetical protein
MPGAPPVCFLATKDHFSSSWASWVAGGKSHEFVVGLPGLVGVADDGVLIDADEAGGLSNAAAVLEVLEDREGLVVGQARAEQGRAFALGEAHLAGAAGEQAALFVLAVAEGDAEVASATPAVVGAMGVLAAEGVEAVHEGGSPRRMPG